MRFCGIIGLLGAIFGFDRTLIFIVSCQECISACKIDIQILSAKSFTEKVKTAFAGFSFAPALA